MSRRKVGIVLAVLITGVVANGLINGPPPKNDRQPARVEVSQTIGEIYPAPWKNDSNSSIVRALKDDGVQGCSSFRYREARRSKSEFLVYCYRGGVAKAAYMVWPNIHKVLGPYQPDASLL